MVWIKAKFILILLFVVLSVKDSFAQESLWKTFNDHPMQEVPSYNGELSPFPQKQKKVDEENFEEVESQDVLVMLDKDTFSEEDKRKMLTTSILAEIKDFLASEEVLVPSLEDLVIEAVAKAKGEYKALIQGKWLKVGDTIEVPVNEAQQALELLSTLKSVDEVLAETVEETIMEKTRGRGQEVVEVQEILKDRVVFKDYSGENYVVNFVKAPF